jgi:predicted dehydrogenase
MTAPFITRNLISAPPSERVRFAGFGAANMAGADIGEIISHPKVDFVAVADVDQNYLAQQKKNHPQLKTYADYRSSWIRKRTSTA